MSLRNVIRNFAVRVLTAGLIGLNYFEAGRRYNPIRSIIPGWSVTDARFDSSSATRAEIVRKAIYFDNNDGIANRLADLFEQFTVGPNGLQVIPSSSDEEWNEASAEVFSEWCQVCDLTSLQSFGCLQSLMARTWFFQGEVFILKTHGRTERGSRPRIQLIEGHRVGTPPDRVEQDGKTIIDGVEIDSNGRPIAYWVRDGIIGESYRRIDAKDIIHVFEPTRVGQYRGLPFLTPVLNELHDLTDLQLLEMKAAKDAAEITNVVNTENGEVPNVMAQLRTNRYGVQGDTVRNDTSTEETVRRDQYLQNKLGARTVALRINEKLEQFRSERPSVAVQAYWDYLTWKICAGVGISKLLVFPFSVQGTVARADLDLANAFFRSRSAVLASAVSEVRRYVMEYATRSDIRVADPPANWRTVTIRPPRAVNVDVGRNSDAKLSELEAGITTYQSIYAEDGKDWRVELRQKAKEAAYIRSLAEEFKIDPAEISTRQVDRPARTEPMPTDDDDEPMPVPIRGAKAD